MANFSNYLENHIINHMLRNQAFTPPTNLYVALFKSPVSEEATSAALEANNPTTEQSGGAYARQALVLTEATTGVAANNANLEFPEATTDWGEITHVAIVDHATNSTWGTNVNVLMWGVLDVAKTVNTGGIFIIETGDLDVAVD